MMKLSSIAALSAAFIVNSAYAVNPPDDRYLAIPAQCDHPPPPSEETFALPCFYCTNISGPPKNDEGDKGNSTTPAPTYTNSFPVASMYTHCNAPFADVYRIYYPEPDCHGRPLLDELIQSQGECPDCSSCKTYGDCGSPGCDRRCCGISIDCSGCLNEAMCNYFGEEQCGGCPDCSNPNPYCESCTHEGICGAMGSYCQGCPGCSNPNPNCKSCTDSDVCASMMGGCTGCPDCSKPPDPCNICTDSDICNVLSDKCTGCPGCSISPDPCKYCSDDYYCALNGQACNGCSGCLIPHDPCKDCTNSAYCSLPAVCTSTCPVCQGRRLESIETSQYNHDMPFRRLDSRNLEDSNSTMAGSYVNITKDIDNKFALGSMHMDGNCSVALGNVIVPVATCLSVPEEADNTTLAIKFECIEASGAITAKLTGYPSKGDCNADRNSTFTKSEPDGSCILAPNNKWGVTIQCTGWGVKPPPPPPPKTPGNGEISVGIRMRYPDRLCTPGAGKQNFGQLRQCGVCVAEAEGVYVKLDCATKVALKYSIPDCTGKSTSESFKNCDGRGIVRGIFSDEIDVGPPNAFGFFTVFGPSGCYAEAVVTNVGAKSGVCTAFQSPGGGVAYGNVDCGSRTLNIYQDERCEGASVFSQTFTDNTCIDAKPVGFVRASCNGYQTPPTMPPTKKPTSNPTEKPITKIPTNKPTFKPTVVGETREPTKAPIPTKAPSSDPTIPQGPSASPTKNPTASPTTSSPTKTRSCNDIPRGCTQHKTDACSGKTAKWTISGKNYECKCTTNKSFKVSFKLKVPSSTVALFNAEKCNAIDIFNGVHTKISEETKAAIINDFPVEVDGAVTQSGGDIIVPFSIYGFLDSTTADTVVTTINTKTDALVAAIKAASGVDVSLSTQASKTEGVSYCGCDKNELGSGAISNFVTSSKFIQAIVTGIVVNAIAQ